MKLQSTVTALATLGLAGSQGAPSTEHTQLRQRQLGGLRDCTTEGSFWGTKENPDVRCMRNPTPKHVFACWVKGGAPTEKEDSTFCVSTKDYVKVSLRQPYAAIEMIDNGDGEWTTVGNSVCKMLDSGYCTDMSNPFVLTSCSSSDVYADDGEVRVFSRPIWQGSGGNTFVQAMSLGGLDDDKKNCDLNDVSKGKWIEEDVSLEAGLALSISAKSGPNGTDAKLTPIASYMGTAWGAHEYDNDFSFDFSMDSEDGYEYSYREGDVITFQNSTFGLVANVVPENQFRRQECSAEATAVNNNTKEFCQNSAAAPRLIAPAQMMTTLGVAAATAVMLLN